MTKRDRKSTTSSVSRSQHDSSKLKYQKKALKAKYPRVSLEQGNHTKELIVQKQSTTKEMLNQYEEFLKNILSEEMESISESITQLQHENPSNTEALNSLQEDVKNYIDSILPAFREEYTKSSESSDNNPLIFLPELPQQQFDLAAQYRNQLRIQDYFLDLLEQYEQDSGIVRQNENLWIGKIPPTDHDIPLSEHVVTTSQRYLDILNTMDQSCDKILDLCNGTKKQMHQSRDIQDQLYDNFEILRNSIAATEKAAGKVPSDPKSLLKGFPKF